MKRVIMYGTFDFLHSGHVSFLRREKAIGDDPIVVLSIDRVNEE